MTRLLTAGLLALATAIAQAGATQQPPAPPPQPQAQPPQQPPAAATGRGQRQGPGVFPAMQRPPADAAVVERGKAVFGVTCVACHGADARGGQLNGPNLLRSQLVLADQDGELI